jgi:hypothetical protein
MITCSALLSLCTERSDASDCTQERRGGCGRGVECLRAEHIKKGNGYKARKVGGASKIGSVNTVSEVRKVSKIG